MMLTVILAQFAAVWNGLVEPVPSLHSPELRQKARLLASLLLVVIFLHISLVLPLGLAVFAAGNVPIHVVAITLNCILLTLMYVVGKRGYVRLAGIAVTVYGTCIIVVVALLRESNNVGVLFFLLIITLFANLFFSARAGVIVAVVHLVIMLLLPFFTVKIRWMPLAQGPLIFYFILSVIVTQYSYIRDRFEAQRQRKLAESEARFRAAVEGSLDAFYLFDTVRDPQGKIINFHLIDSNLPVEEGGALPEPFYQKIFAHLVKVVEKGKAHSEEIHFPTAQGDVWVHYQVVNVGDGVAVFSRDITERKRAEAALRQSEYRYRIVSETISDYAYSISLDPDGSGHREWLTDSFKHLTGYTNEEIDARGLFDLYHPDDKDRVLESLEHLKQGQPSEGEYRIITKSGESRWVYITRFPEWNEQEQRTVRFYCVARDITGRKQAEQVERDRERLKIALESERQLSQIKNKLMMTISHEFRTPLATIQASSDILQRYFDRMTSEQRAGHAATIENQVKHLTGMLEDITFAVQNASGQISPRFERTDLTEETRKVVEDTRRALSNGHNLLCEAPQTVECMVDLKLFRRIMHNLLSNAVKFSPNGGDIRVEVLNEGDCAVVRVHDQGIGISSEDQSRLFQPFFHGSTSGIIEGAGMGLSIVNDCVALHGGSITVASEPGVGSTFTIRLPMTAIKV
jgi:PAS domain S-box-containing protein